MIFGIAASLLAGYLSVLGVMYVAQRSLMYHPGPLVGTPSTYGISDMTRITIPNGDGEKITSWYRPPKKNQDVIVYFHGNAGAISDRADKITPYLRKNFGVVLVAYRGFGGNPGKPSELGLYDDASTLLTYLKSKNINPSRWILYGESLGAGVATEMAYQYALKGTPVSSVILEAPFTSMGDAAAAHYPFIPTRLLVRDKYDSISKINKINAPLMILHGNLDRTIPQKLGRRLFETANKPKTSLWVEGASHNDLYDFGVADHVIHFVNQNKCCK